MSFYTLWNIAAAFGLGVLFWNLRMQHRDREHLKEIQRLNEEHLRAIGKMRDDHLSSLNRAIDDLKGIISKK